MRDAFFEKQNCDRCGGSLKGGRIMSMYNDDCLCMECKSKECNRSDYKDAVEADHAEIRKGVRVHNARGQTLWCSVKTLP